MCICVYLLCVLIYDDRVVVTFCILIVILLLLLSCLDDGGGIIRLGEEASSYSPFRIARFLSSPCTHKTKNEEENGREEENDSRSTVKMTLGGSVDSCDYDGGDSVSCGTCSR